jgi:hypothetical protein
MKYSPAARFLFGVTSCAEGTSQRIDEGLCTVCGCKKSTIERWAEAGSWVVGIGGKNTGKPDRLIYAMRVEQTPSYSAFKKADPARAAYLSGHGIASDAPVLVSSEFYYFGDQARSLPQKLSRIIHRTQGCKRLLDSDIDLLKEWLNSYGCGADGKPNNLAAKPSCSPC